MTGASTMTWLLLPLAVSAVVFLYSSVGYGGATGCLAIVRRCAPGRLSQGALA